MLRNRERRRQCAILLTVVLLAAMFALPSRMAAYAYARAAADTDTKAGSGTPSPKAGDATGSPSPAAGDVSGSPSPSAENVSGSPSPSAENVSGSPSPAAGEVSGSPSPAAGDVSGSPSPAVSGSVTPDPGQVTPDPGPATGTVTPAGGDAEDTPTPTPTKKPTPTPMVIRDEMAAYINTSPHANVRVDAGTDKALLRDKDGYTVELTTGTLVRVYHKQDKVVGSGNNALVWNKISFTFRGQKMEGYTSSTNLIEYDEEYRDEEFEKELDRQGFPESYRELLRAVHMRNPNWVFVAQHTGLDWSEAVDAQYSKFGTASINSDVPSSWKSTETDKNGIERYNWAIEDSEGNLVDGGWIKHDYKYESASREMISYAMDPRNFLAERTLFMFQLQSYMPDVQTVEGVESILKGTDLSGTIPNEGITYAEAFMQAAEQSGVSPYALAIRSVHEVNRSKIISGTYPGYEGYYNYYNFNAYKTDKYNVIENGLRFAMTPSEEDLRPWNTRLKAIVGGAIRLGATYINVGQDTSYLQKYNVSKTHTYRHQYMSNVTALYEQASSYYNRIIALGPEAVEAADVFKIPVYLNMPSTACARPIGDGNPNPYLADLSVEGMELTPNEFKYGRQDNEDDREYELVVEEETESVKVTAKALASATKIQGTGEIKLAHGLNTINIVCTAGNGTKVTYVLNIFRKGEGLDPPVTPEPSVSPEPSGTPGDVTPTPSVSGTPEPTVTVTPTPEPKKVESESFMISEDDQISGVAPGTDVASLLAGIKCTNCETVEICKPDGTVVTEGNVGTGYILRTDIGEYTIIIYGDVNSDGKISSLDLLYVRRHLLELVTLDGAPMQAADVKGGDGITSLDLLYIKRHILEIAAIDQTIVR